VQKAASLPAAEGVQAGQVPVVEEAGGIIPEKLHIKILRKNKLAKRTSTYMKLSSFSAANARVANRTATDRERSSFMSEQETQLLSEKGT